MAANPAQPGPALSPATVVDDPRTGAVKPVMQAPGQPPFQSYGPPGSQRSGYPGPLSNLAMINPLPDAAQAVPPAGAEGWDSPPPPPTARVPSSSAQIMLPGKAIAGQFLTVAVLNQNHAAEPLVELSFNGAALTTAQDGKALFLVPEDATPGPTLQVSMVARPDAPPLAIQVLQPLMLPTSPQIPRVDQISPLAQAGGTITIDGHSFDGVADRNRVIVDGMWDARVIAASPVELKADLPSSLAPGQHSISVSTAGLRSNPGLVEVVALDLQPDVKEVGKEVMTKLIVRALGTRSPVRVHLKNFSTEVIKLQRGNDLRFTTPGGPNNSVVLGVQRLRKGNYHVEAVIE